MHREKTTPILYTGSAGNQFVKIGNFGYNHWKNPRWGSRLLTDVKKKDAPRAVLVVDGKTRVFFLKIPHINNKDWMNATYKIFFNRSEIQEYPALIDFSRITKVNEPTIRVKGKTHITVAEFLPGKWVWTVYWPKRAPITEASGPVDLHINFHIDPSPRSRFFSTINNTFDYDNPLLYLPYTNTNKRMKPQIGDITFRDPTTKKAITAISSSQKLALSRQIQKDGIEIIAVSGSYLHPGKLAYSGIYRIGYRVEGTDSNTKAERIPKTGSLTAWTFDKLPPGVLQINASNRKLVVIEPDFSKFTTTDLTKKSTGYLVSRTEGDKTKTFDIGSLKQGAYTVVVIAENIRQGGKGDGKRAKPTTNKVEKKVEVIIDHTPPRWIKVKLLEKKKKKG